jgi:hypothetical protein
MAVYVVQLDNDPPSSVTQAGAVLARFGSTADIDHLPFSDGVVYTGFCSSVRKTAGNPSDSMASAPCVVSMISASGSFQVYINGNSLFSTASNVFALNADPPRIGWDVATNLVSHYVDGRVGEIVAVANNVSSTTRQLIEGYMGHQWGAIGNFPSNHPYKSSAPTP